MIMTISVFGFHGWLHVIMTAVIAVLIKKCVEFEHFGNAAWTPIEPNSIVQDSQYLTDSGKSEENKKENQMANEKYMKRKSDERRVGINREDSNNGNRNDDSELSSMELFSKASTFFVDMTVGTFMHMTQAHIFEAVSDGNVKANRMENQILMEKGSSVWCTGSSHTDRICRFHNLCYFPDEDDFAFFHSEHSVISGVPTDRFSPTLLDMSSVLDHNQQYFNYIDLKSSEAAKFNVEFINTQSLIYRRFNPDNLMHVFHDDLLPMFSTLQMIYGKPVPNNMSAFDIQLVFMEGWSPGDYVRLYEVFSLHKLLFKSDLQARSSITCFRDAYIGLRKDTVWYQYGFRIPQGPVPDYKVTAHEIRHFTQYLKRRLDIDSQHVPNGDKYVVLFSRKHNRMILNEVEVTLALVQELKLKVITVGAETHSVAEMVAILSKAVVLIGMHGSLLSLSMFLSPGAILIELFPYAVNPNNYTPYKTLANLNGMGLLYRAWRNLEVKNTITYPDRPWDTGGIVHLSQDEQDHIMHSAQVPKHLCCRDPEWLFRAYQDTIVDIPSLISLVHNVMEVRDQKSFQSLLHSADISMHRIYPAQVLNIRCEGNDLDNDLNINLKSLTPPSLWLSWDPPWNIQYIEVSNIKYEVWIQEAGLEHYTAWIMSRNSYQFTVGLKPNTAYNIWVRCIVNDHIQGPFNQEHIGCST